MVPEVPRRLVRPEVVAAMLSLIDYSDLGREFVRDQLRGGATLAQLMLTRAHWWGPIRAILPSSVHGPRDPKYGGIIEAVRLLKDHSGDTAIEIPNTDEYLGQYIYSYLARADGSACVFEDAIVRPSDPDSVNAINSLIFKDELYHCVCKGDALEAIRETLRRAKSINSFIGFLVRNSASLGCRGRRVVEFGDLATLASGVDEIVIGAFDGESYLLVQTKAE